MSQDDELEQDVLFLGATRPAMMFGVSFDFLIINLFFSGMIFLGVGNPLYLFLALPGHGIGYIVCMNDPNTFGVLFKWLVAGGKCRNRMFWKKSTYTPN